MKIPKIKENETMYMWHERDGWLVTRARVARLYVNPIKTQVS